MSTLLRTRGIVKGAFPAAIIILTIFAILPGIGWGLPITEGFNNFDTGTRPSGWIFNGCNADSDTYTGAGDFGLASPSIKLDTTGNYIQTTTLFHPDALQFWVKGMGTDASSALLVEEYYSGSGWTALTNVTALPAAGTNFGPYSMQFLATEARFTYTKSVGDLAFDDVDITAAAPTVTPSITPSVTPTAEPTATPTLTPVPTATPTPLDNFHNPSFELEPPLTGWTTEASSTDRSDEQAYAGTYSCKFKDPTYDYDGREIMTADSVLVPIVPGKDYIFSGWFYVLYETGIIEETLFTFDIRWTSGTEVVYTDSNVGWSLTAFNDWQQKGYTETAPLTADGVRIYIACADAEDHNNNNDVYIDVFNMVRAPEISVTAPATGDPWYIGESYNILWNSFGMSENVDIHYQTNGTDWAPIAINIADSGTYSWSVADDPSSQALVRVQNNLFQWIYGESGQFTIAERDTINVTSPIGGETWYRTVAYDVTWNYGPLVGSADVDLEYSIDSGTSWRPIDSGVGIGSSPYSWTIPAEDSDLCLVRVTQTSSGIFGESPAVFTMNSPTFTVTSPAGGEYWYSSDARTITWDSTAGITGNVDIDYSITGAYGPWTSIATNEDNDGSFSSWNIPNISTSRARVRISEVGAGVISIPGISADNFTLKGTSPPAPYRPFIWTVMNEIDTTCSLRTIEALDADHIWVSGSCGVIFFWDGLTWVIQDEISDVKDFKALAPDNVWAGAYGGGIYHFDGSTWSVAAAAPRDVRDIDACDPNHIMADSYKNQKAFMTTGETPFGSSDWLNYDFGGSSVRNVVYLKPDLAFAVKSPTGSGLIYKSTDRLNWTYIAGYSGGMNNNPFDGCLDENGDPQLWIAGDCGRIGHYDGSTGAFSYQTRVVVGAGWPNFESVAVLDEHNVWASGKGVLYRYDGTEWFVEDNDLSTFYTISVVNNRLAYAIGSTGSQKIYIGRPEASPTPTPEFTTPTPEGKTPTPPPPPGPGPISGRVYDRITGIGVSDLYIRALPVSSGLIPGTDTTDSNGNYTIPSLDTGLYYMYVDTNTGSGIKVYRSQWYNQKDTQYEAAEVGSNSIGIDFPLYEMGVHPTPTVTPPPVFQPIRVENGDYNGDGLSDIAIFRQSSGLWAIRAVTRVYFGTSGDTPVSGDYDGDGTADVALFRSSSSLWAIRNISRTYFGDSSDLPVPGDYDGDGSCDIGIFRGVSGLWAVKGLTRSYFGGSSDQPVAGDYDGDGLDDFAIFRGSSSLWAIQDISRIYYGNSSDTVVSGDYDGTGTAVPAIYRPASGLWAIRNLTRVYFGSVTDQPVPAGFSGLDDIGIFRPSNGLWAIRGVTRVYYGTFFDLPVTR